MAKCTEENLRKAKANLGRFYGLKQKVWKRQGFIPDMYLDNKCREYISEQEAGFLRKVLHLKSLRYGFLAAKNEIGANTLTDFRRGQKRLFQWQYDHIRRALEALSDRIEDFIRKPVMPTLTYLKEVCELLEDYRLVKTTIYRSIEGCPRPILTWFYAGVQQKYGSSIEMRMRKYLPFFERLRGYFVGLREQISHG